MQRIILMAGDSLGAQALEDCWEWSVLLATALGENMLVATVNEAMIPVSEFTFAAGMVSHGEIVRPAIEPAPGAAGVSALMPSSKVPAFGGAARTDWTRLRRSVGELALQGGSPVRSPESAIVADESCSQATDIEDCEVVMAIQRGILESTGLWSALSDGGWLGVECESQRMAAWLCAAIILENVDARINGSALLVPTRPDFALDDEVEGVITVVAKAVHAWRSLTTEVSTRRSPLQLPSPAAMAVARAAHGHYG